MLKTKKKRWKDGYSHISRSEYASKIIKKYKPQTLLDVGAGNMDLKKFLPIEIGYTPADLYKRNENTIVFDLNKKQFTNKKFDFISAIGLIEYLNDPIWFLNKCYLHSKILLFTYNIYKNNFLLNFLKKKNRKKLGYFNHYNLDEILKLLNNSSYKKYIHLKKNNKFTEDWFICFK